MTLAARILGWRRYRRLARALEGALVECSGRCHKHAVDPDCEKHGRSRHAPR